MVDRLITEGDPHQGRLASPIAQYRKKTAPLKANDEYEAVRGQNGAPYAQLVDVNGNPLTPASGADILTLKNELALVKSELQTIKNSMTDGNQKVQLIGNLGVDTEVLSALAITDTNWKTTVEIPAIWSPNMYLIIISTLNQVVTVRPAISALSSGSSGSSVGFFKDKDNKAIETVVPSLLSMNFNERMVVSNTEMPLLDYLKTRSFRLHLRCANAPTAGSITIRVGRGG